ASKTPPGSACRLQNRPLGSAADTVPASRKGAPRDAMRDPAGRRPPDSCMPKRSPFLQALSERVILGDGGMGSEIYDRGVFINRCYDELNLANARLVRRLHT